MSRLLILGLAAVVLSAGPLSAGPYDDDFNDNAQGPAWTLIEDAPAVGWLDETNNRLEYRTLQSAGTPDALYLSNGPSGFALSTASDFQMKVDFSFGTPTAMGTVGGAGLDFGLGTDPSGIDSLSIGHGISWAPGLGTQRAFAYAYRINNVQTTLLPDFTLDTTGTLYISYNSGLDEVYLSHVGYGAGDADNTLSGLVQGDWGATQVLVGLGGRGGALQLDSGQAWLDNFVLTSGTVVAAPEPSVLALLALGSAGLVRAARRRRVART